MSCICCNLFHLHFRTFHICRSALSLSTFVCASISFFGSFNHFLPCHDSSLRILWITSKYFACYLVIIILKAAVTSPFSLSGKPSSSFIFLFALIVLSSSQYNANIIDASVWFESRVEMLCAIFRKYVVESDMFEHTHTHRPLQSSDGSLVVRSCALSWFW